MVGAWPRLKRLRNRQNLEAARQDLIDRLISFSTYRGYRTVVVFDAQMVTTPLAWEMRTPHLEVCFTDYEQTADTFIEQYSYQLLRGSQQRVLVATSDRAQQLLVMAQGAGWLSAEILLQEVRQVEQQIHENLRRRRSQPGRTLADHLDPKVRERFAQWRGGQP